MSIRDLLIIAIVFGSLPFIVARPHVGVLMWSWLAYMNPHRLTWGIAYELPFSLMVAAATVIGLLLTSESKRIPWNLTTMTLLFWVGWMTLTTQFAFVPEEAWPEWERMIKVQFMNVVALMLMGSRQRLNVFIWVIVVSIGFYGVRGGVFTVLTGGEYMVFGPEDSFFEGNTGLGLVMLMTLPLMYYLRSNTENAWLRWVLLGMMGLTSIAIIGTYSRGALLGGAAVAFFLWLKSSNKVLLATIMLVMVPLFISFMPDAWMDRMETIETYEQDSSAMGRINAWKFATNVAKDRPVVGGGFRVFTEELYLRYAPNPDYVADAHSVYFEVLGEHGFVGLGVFLSFFALAWRTASWAVRQTKNKPELRWASELAHMLQVSLVAYAVSGAFLGMAYLDLFYNIVTIIVLTRVLVERELSVATGEARPGPGESARRPKLVASERTV